MRVRRQQPAGVGHSSSGLDVSAMSSSFVVHQPASRGFDTRGHRSLGAQRRPESCALSAASFSGVSTICLRNRSTAARSPGAATFHCAGDTAGLVARPEPAPDCCPSPSDRGAAGAVARALPLHDIVQHRSAVFRTRARLCLVIFKHVEKFRNRHAGLAVYEVKDPVMGSPEAVLRSGSLVRVRREVAIGRKKNSSMIAKSISLSGPADSAAGRLVAAPGMRHEIHAEPFRKFYVSLVDIN